MKCVSNEWVNNTLLNNNIDMLRTIASITHLFEQIEHVRIFAKEKIGYACYRMCVFKYLLLNESRHFFLICCL